MWSLPYQPLNLLQALNNPTVLLKLDRKNDSLEGNYLILGNYAAPWHLGKNNIGTFAEAALTVQKMDLEELDFYSSSSIYDHVCLIF